MNMKVMSQHENEFHRMQLLLETQRKAYRAMPMPDKQYRISKLNALKSSLLKYKDKLASALDKDFGCRSKDETMIAEIVPAINAIKYSIKHLHAWMKPSRRHLDISMQPAKARVIYQPLGVVGIIVPWNYPIAMTLQPLICALGAGNRAMIKFSEFTPNTNKVLTEMLSEAFAEDYVATVEGEAEVASAFAGLGFDHLLFTGSSAVGKKVMQAAAENLTPVTLELGGKSPTIIDDKIPLGKVIERIVFGKSLNSGQTCTAPDYILCPKSRCDEFVEEYRKVFVSMFPTLKSNADYTSVVNQRQYERLQGYLSDAEQKGANIVAINPANEDMQSGTCKIAPHLVLNTTDDMKIRQEEIFGPILPIVPYESFDEVIDYVNDRPRPLALYLFSYDKKKQQRILEETHAGGVCINETLLHTGVDSLPFGGVGNSGMGHYHGWEGFEAMSKAKSVLQKGAINGAKSIYAPYGKLFHKVFYKLMLR